MTSASYITCISLLLFGGVLPACRMNRGAEVHIIPEGFVGPVVIVYGVPGGEEGNRDDDGTTVYRIPPNGKLFVKRPPPESGWYRMTYVVAARDGTHELPHEFPTPTDPNRFQVVGREAGAVMRIDGRDVGEITYRAYFVGIPAQHSAWGQARQRLVDEAVREAAAAMKSTGRIPPP